MPRILISNLLGLVGAAIGGVLGFYTFGWFWSQGFYGLMIPGAFLGLGCSLLARHPSIVRGIVVRRCRARAVALHRVEVRARSSPTPACSISYSHVKDLSPVTLLMIGVATFIAFWVGGDAGFRGISLSGRPARPAGASSKLPDESLERDLLTAIALNVGESRRYNSR